MPDEKKPEVTDLVPEPDKNQETNTAKASKSGKKMDLSKGKPSVAKLTNFTNGKLRD